MAITLDTATALEALALKIFDLHLVPNPPAQAGLGAHFDPTLYTGIKAQDSTLDGEYLALIAPVMLAIDGDVMATGFEYTLNITCALMGRPRHWYLEGVNEFAPSVLPPCGVAFTYIPPPGGAGLSGDWQSYGFTLGGAACAAICKLWAQIIRMWLGGTYPYAVTQPA